MALFMLFREKRRSSKRRRVFVHFHCRGNEFCVKWLRLVCRRWRRRCAEQNGTTLIFGQGGDPLDSNGYAFLNVLLKFPSSLRWMACKLDPFSSSFRILQCLQASTTPNSKLFGWWRRVVWGCIDTPRRLRGRDGTNVISHDGRD